MTRSDRIVDWTLGELPPGLGREVRRLVQSDPRAAVEAAEVGALLEDLKTLAAEPSGRVGVALRYAVGRRNRLHRPRSALGHRIASLGPVLGSARGLVRVAAVAAATLVGLVLWQPGSPGREPVVGVAEWMSPIWTSTTAPVICSMVRMASS